ncbi:hypothetical protein V8C42DRAFT_98252 [Trichoderma barbatum]
MGWYAWILATSNCFAPVICGFINDSMGFKWPFYFMTIFSGACFVFLLFFLEEANYNHQSVGVITLKRFMRIQVKRRPHYRQRQRLAMRATKQPFQGIASIAPYSKAKRRHITRSLFCLTSRGYS